MSDEARARRKQLGRLLRKARQAVRPKLTQEAVAAELGCRQAKINKIEMTLVGIDPPELEKLIGLYNVPAGEADELRTLARLDQQNGPPRTTFPTTLDAYDELSEVETEAREIRCWHSERLPVPLQSEMYILKQHELLITNNDVTPVLRKRAARTKVFTVAKPPLYRVIISESSLHRLPGGRTDQMVVDQTGHLLELMKRYQRLELRILTFDADILWADTDFQHLMFDKSTHSEFVYVEHPGGSRKCKSQYELDECRATWASLDRAALTVAESRDFLTELARQAGSTSY